MVQKYKGKWRVQIRVNGKICGHLWTRKTDAQKEEDTLREEKELTRAGLELPQEDILVIDYAAKWLRRRVERVEHGTFVMDEKRLTLDILPVIGTRPLRSVTTGDIRSLLDEIQERLKIKDSTRNRYRALLHTLFEDAFMDEKVIANPISRIELLKESPRRIHPMAREEADQLIQAAYAESSAFGFCLILMLWEGRRISEACATQNGDFDLKRDEYRVSRIYEQSSKTVRDGIKGRPDGLTIPLFPVVKEALIRHLRETRFKAPDAFCISEDASNTPLSTFAIRNRLYGLCESLKMRKITPHVLRATFATFAEEAGFSKEDIQRMLGHSTVIVTEKYTRRSAQPLLEKGVRLDFGTRLKNVIQLKKGRK